MQITQPNPAIKEYFIPLKYLYKVIWIMIGAQGAGMLTQAIRQAR
jgi:hypothetical protein